MSQTKNDSENPPSHVEGEITDVFRPSGIRPKMYKGTDSSQTWEEFAYRFLAYGEQRCFTERQYIDSLHIYLSGTAYRYFAKLYFKGCGFIEIMSAMEREFGLRHMYEMVYCRYI